MTIKEFINKSSEDYTTCIIELNGYKFKGGYNDREHCIWDAEGNKSVYSWKGNLDINFEQLEKLLNYTINGIEYCNICFKQLGKGQGHRYFAGIYCDDCFTDKMRNERDWAYSHLD